MKNYLFEGFYQNINFNSDQKILTSVCDMKLIVLKTGFDILNISKRQKEKRKMS